MELGYEYEAAVEQVIEEGIACGEFDGELRPRIVGYAVIGAANWTHRWFVPGGSMTGAEVGELFADLFACGLVGGVGRRER